MSKQRTPLISLRILLILLAGSLLLAQVLAQGKGNGGKGKPPAGPDARFEVRYALGTGFNFIPDGEGLFNGGPCSPPDCPYVDGANGFKIVEEGGGFKQLQQRDEDLHAIYYEIYETNSHYRHFSTDIEWQAIEGNLCPSLLDPDSDWTLGGGYNGELWQKTMFSLWIDTWPDAGQGSSWSTGSAIIRGMVPLGGESDDFDADGASEDVLTKVSPGWELVWDEQEYPGSVDLMITPMRDDFLVTSGTAMLRVKRPNGGRFRECGLVNAAFELLATPIS